MNLGRLIRWLSVLSTILLLISTGSSHVPMDMAPHIIFHPTATPYPKAPFPNDELFTVPDPSSITGLRIQMPVFGHTDFERVIREKLNTLNGFGTYAPIMVPFDSRIDIATINADSIHVINLNKTSSSYGERTPIDFGSGLYEYRRKGPDGYFKHDPLYQLDNFFFAQHNRAVFYEDATNTLILRPTFPLHEENRYAVVLTHALKGETGFSIRSERAPAKPLMDELKNLGTVDPGHIVYAWDFTTQSISRDLRVIRDGLYGKGTAAFLHQRFPPHINTISNLGTFPFNIDGDSHLLTPTVIALIVRNVAVLLEKLKIVDPLNLEELIQWPNVDYFIFGSFVSPQFNKNKSGMFNFDIQRGITPYTLQRVTFTMAIPKTTEFSKPPFPVAIYGHGNKRSRIDTLGLANKLAEGGIATATIDADTHGPENVLASLPVALKRFFSGKLRPKTETESILKPLSALAEVVGIKFSKKDVQNEGMMDPLIDLIFDTGILRVLTKEGRATDIDDDGITDSGEAFFSADMFQTRDIIRQTLIDEFQFVRVIKSLGADHNDDGLFNREEGDFNADGISDVGGPENKLYYIGMSLGGMLGSNFVALEDNIKTAVLNVGGGGLVDILMRSKSKFNVERVFYQLWGPAISGIPKLGHTQLLLHGTRPKTISKIKKLKEGTFVHLRNTRNNLSTHTRVTDAATFTIKVPADRDDLLELSFLNKKRQVFEHKKIKVTHQQGLGYQRNTPEFLRLAFMGQWIIDPSDPINYAPHLRHKNILLQVALGDWTVPTGTGVNLAHAARLVSPERLQWLVDNEIHLGKIMDVDTPQNPPESTRGAAVRFHPSGKHEYMVIPSVENEDQMSYTKISQDQMLKYFLTDGNLID